MTLWATLVVNVHLGSQKKIVELVSNYVIYLRNILCFNVFSVFSMRNADTVDPLCNVTPHNSKILYNVIWIGTNVSNQYNFLRIAIDVKLHVTL